MNAKVSVVVLLCALQASTILADSNVINEYAPIIFDSQLRLEQVKISFGLIEANIRKNVSKIAEKVHQSASEFREYNKIQIEESTAEINCNPNSELKCKSKKEEEILNDLDTSPLAAVKTCIGVFSGPINEAFTIFPSYYDHIDNIIANITNVNEFCTQTNSTSDVIRLCFFEELAFNILPLAEKVLQEEKEQILNNMNSTIASSQTKLTNCAILLLEDVKTKSKNVIKNYEYCCGK